MGHARGTLYIANVSSPVIIRRRPSGKRREQDEIDTDEAGTSGDSKYLVTGRLFLVQEKVLLH